MTPKLLVRFIYRHLFAHDDAATSVKVKFSETATPGSFKARDNVANFIKWAKALGIDSSVMFETDDLVADKNEKNVLYWFVPSISFGQIL